MPASILNGTRVEVSIFDSGDVPHMVASMAGVLMGAYSITGGEPTGNEAIFVRLECGDEPASLSLDRELFTAGQLHDDGTIALPDAVLKGPSSTWTYLVSDDPFRNQIGMMLTGPGRATVGIGSALMAMPLLITWGLIDRLFRKRGLRR